MLTSDVLVDVSEIAEVNNHEYYMNNILFIVLKWANLPNQESELKASKDGQVFLETWLSKEKVVFLLNNVRPCTYPFLDLILQILTSISFNEVCTLIIPY
jgi:hypothetical protein